MDMMSTNIWVESMAFDHQLDCDDDHSQLNMTPASILDQVDCWRVLFKTMKLQGNLVVGEQPLANYQRCLASRMLWNKLSTVVRAACSMLSRAEQKTDKCVTFLVWMAKGAAIGDKCE